MPSAVHVFCCCKAHFDSVVVKVRDEDVVSVADGEERGPGELVARVALLAEFKRRASCARVG